MEIVKAKKAVKFSIDLTLKTPLMIRSGKTGEFTDSVIEKTGDENCLHINGYVWASLIRRALSRVKGAENMTEEIGDYAKGRESEIGVSPFWCEASFVELEPGDVRPGNKLDRQWGAAAKGALFSDEIVQPGYKTTLNFNYFCENPGEIKKNILSALWVIDQGIENIGGGWSYGYGRLAVNEVKYKELELTDPKHRDILWKFEDIQWNSEKITIEKITKPEISRPWKKIKVWAKIPDCQLLCISTTLPPSDIKSYSEDNFPDSFVFRRGIIDDSGEKQEEIAVTGKALRQALFSVPIERRLRTKGETICLDSSKSKECRCKRCSWFGSVDSRGRISISDAPVTGAETKILNRIQLCEHSMQNMNLFTWEYLTKGDFYFEIMIDRIDEDESADLLKDITNICEDMKVKAPPGWYRIGGSSTCTGQVEIKDYRDEDQAETRQEDK
ncbi:CRISPR type III-associated RAMP domain-containing protein [Desulfonema limicola]|uniref:CRISPR type III-associated RAMP domain-containing protein n=1 Tax=Desulfonema limicola TaxID=45656 RepID=A0A975BAT4_9BACT|nr:RAMP superfamily CRISPR-associated protein [Desulfonema limicola]QTA81755.1 CRISPR type III-associated RAMP domain-containing protein [Desulfonema limicola]